MTSHCAAAAARVGGATPLLAKRRAAGHAVVTVALAVPPSSSSSSPSPLRRDNDADADAPDEVYAARARNYQALVRKTATKTTKAPSNGIEERRRRRRRLDDDDFDDGNLEISAAQTLRSGWFDLELSLLLLPILVVASPWLFAHPLALLVAGISALTLPGSGRALQGLAREAKALFSASPPRADPLPPRRTLRDPSAGVGMPVDPRRRPPRRPSLPSSSSPASSAGPATAAAAATRRPRRSAAAGPPSPRQRLQEQQQSPPR